MPPPTRCVYVSSHPVPPHQSLPPRGKVARRKPGRMRGGSVKATTSGKKPTFPPLISQKSKIFASFSPGGSLPNCPVRYIEVNLLLFIGASRFHNYHSPTVVTSRTWLAISAKAAVSRFSWAAVSVLMVMMPPSCFWKSAGTVPLVRISKANSAVWLPSWV